MWISLRIIGPAVLLLAIAAPVRAEIRPDYEMDHDPEISVPPAVKVFSERLKGMWLEALARPEADMQRMAADAISRAHAEGFVDMGDAVPRLAAILTDPASHLAARRAAARALVMLDAKEKAPQLAKCAQKYGSDFRQIVEPALAAWTFTPYYETWQARLAQTHVRRRDLVLAIRCLATARDVSSAPGLVAIVLDRLQPPDVRLEAARASGLLQNSGLEANARQLLAARPQTTQINRQCAVHLLAFHDGDEAQKLLLDLAVDREPAVAVVALQRLNKIAPQRVLPLAADAMQSADPKVRQCGADACSLRPDPARVIAMSRLLDDPHPDVRRSVCAALYELARQPPLDTAVRQAATEMLAGNRWRGLEQASLLLGALDHKPAAERLIELLEFDRPEVGIAAAWALKKLSIEQTLPQMLDKALRNTVLRKARQTTAGLDELTAHLLEAFGRMKFAPAKPLLLEHVPKDALVIYGVPSRAAAVWSLGFFHVGSVDESLARTLMQRIADDGGPGSPPELDPVKRSAAATIARMKAISQAASLRKYYESKEQSNRVTVSLHWAMQDLTGEQIPILPAPKLEKKDWFLESLAE